MRHGNFACHSNDTLDGNEACFFLLLIEIAVSFVAGSC